MTTPAGDPDKTARVSPSTPFTPQYGGAESQFAPGTVIAARYRIASILGTGGMGEVYRADDVKLGQAVALKFLPARLARDPMLLARLHDEVRLGRQVAHPNVCRIYDIGEYEGAHFVAMEYVDGEDLARLLHRIGRLAHDKAVDIARGIAAGLMAAHAKGIVHRDLKPANVMIDSHGDARITDFGLALSDADDQQGEIAGTPAYMAPEQLEGQPATVQSDLYALGLVMYELFTGRRAHTARTLPERVRDVTSEITTPSAHIRDIDPAVEKIILRCLNNDPMQRPRSARQVIEALPGGDPLAAAMAAGETPSPRIVAAAGSEGSIRPAVAWTLLAIALAGLIALVAIRRAHSLFTYVTLEKRPEVLEERATTLLRDLGIGTQPYASTSMDWEPAYVGWIIGTDSTPRRWERLRRGVPAVTFRYRQSAEPLAPNVPTPAPPGGLTELTLDPRGRLWSLSAIPQPSWTPRPLDWKPLFAAAGLDASRLTPATPQIIAAGETRAAWTGTHPDDGTPIRVEAAAWRGTPVLFRVAGPWDDAAHSRKMPFGGTALMIFFAVLIFATVVFGLLLAWRNLRLRRGDRAGALRLAVAMFALVLLAKLLRADHQLSTLYELQLLSRVVGEALLSGATAWALYLAIEPYLRRRWPDTLISWTRLLTGRWRDPMVGRDIILGVLVGAVHAALSQLGMWLPALFGRPASMPYSGAVPILSGTRHVVAFTMDTVASGITQGFILMTILLAFTLLFRRRSLGVAGLAAVLVVAYLLAAGLSLSFACMMVTSAMTVTLAVRYGLLALATAQAAFHLSFGSTLTADATWYTGISVIPALVLLAITLWAFRTSLGDQTPFGALEDFAK